LIKHLKHRWGFLALTIILLGIFAHNFPTGRQWLIGWDALNPELNFGLNLKYALNAAWQPHYGTGALIGHGYAATLPHVLIAGLMSLFLPLNAVRPTFIFLCWYLGAVGMYLLLRYLFEKVNLNKATKVVGPQTVLAIAGALFYSFNVGTTQIFYHPLEAFTAQFALIPWMLLLIERYFDNPNHRKLLWLFLVVFIGSIQGFIPSNFIAFMVLIISFLLIKILGRNWLQRLKQSLLVLATITFANSYWLPPFVYYTLTNSQVYLDSYQNQLSTPQFVAKTAKYGTLDNVITLKSFFLEGKLFGEDAFSPWLQFLDKYPVEYWYYSIFGLAVFGSLLLFQKKYRFSLAYLMPAVLFFATLATQIPGFAELNTTLYEFVPLYEQAFRTAFTKVGPSYFALLTILAWLSLHWLITFHRKKILGWLLSILVLVMVSVTAWPHVMGQSFYKQLKVEMPTAYNQVINFFDQQPENGYVADLPLGCPDGWYSYNWGYSGSGFYWYGVKQPFLSRAFDVWNQYNESYYWQTNRAIRERDFVTLDTVFDKYQVNWVLIDENLEHCRSNQAFGYIPELKEYLNKKDTYQQVFFSNEDVSQPITIFERKINQPSKTGHVVDQIDPISDWDYLFSGQQSYVENMERSQQQNLLFSQKNRLNEQLAFVVDESTTSAKLQVIDKNNPSKNITAPVSFFNLDTVLKPKTCLATNTNNMYEQTITPTGQIKSVRVETIQDSDCVSFSADSQEFSQGGILSFDAYNYAGQPFKLTISDNLSQVYLEQFVKDGLNTFSISPSSPDAETLNFLFSSQAYGDISSGNLLKNISLGTIDISLLEQFFVPEIDSSQAVKILNLEWQNSPYQTHTVQNYDIAILPVSYDPAWFAFARPASAPWWQPSNYHRLSHHRYNGWANAWEVPGCAESAEGSTDTTSRDAAGESINPNCQYNIIIFYWPQLLSWAGYVLLLTRGGWLIYRVWRSRSGDARSQLQPGHQSASHPKRHRLARATKNRLAP